MVLRLSLYLLCFQLFIIICTAEDFNFAFPEELDEGSQCVQNENNEIGICKKITECPKILTDIRQGLRNWNINDRCNIFGSKELACCPLKQVSVQFGLRPADVACQHIQSQARFIEGFITGTFESEKSVDGELPFVASLGYPDQNDKNIINYNCGGSLISTTYVLTAAHCFINVHGEVPVEVRMGSVNLEISTDAVQRIAIKDLYAHPKYRISAHYYDIGLVKLQNPVQITTTVNPVCLYTEPISNNSPTNDTLIVAGYRVAQFGEESDEKILKSYSLRLVSKSICDEAFAGLRKLQLGIHESMLCGKDSDKTRGFDVCGGDSGGPLLLRKENRNSLVGIISFGAGCIGISPTVYTLINPYLDWIESYVWGQ